MLVFSFHLLAVFVSYKWLCCLVHYTFRVIMSSWWWWLFCCQVTSCSLPPHRLQHAGLPCPSPSPGVCPHSCPLNQWCHPTISSSVTLFFCLPCFPASGSFPGSWLFALGSQSVRTSASASVLRMSIKGWFSLRLADLISLLSKGLSRVFSSTTLRKHQCFGALPPLWSHSHICTWLLESP